MAIRGVRGAVVVEENIPESIYRATRDLLSAIAEANPTLEPSDLASVYFTVTADLDAAFPALGARSMPGWEHVPYLCAREITVPGSLDSVIRTLIHWNTERSQEKIQHVYLGEAARLRPDLSKVSRV